MFWRKALVAGAAVPLVLAILPAAPGAADHGGPHVLDPTLEVLEEVGGLARPIGMAFLDEDEFFVLEKDTGLVKLVRAGEVVSTVLDLPVNFASERGLLAIALHPQFPADPGVYLRWTESISGTDTNVLADTPLLGNRVDRFEWNGTTLTFDEPIIALRSRQNDDTNRNNAGVVQERGNHNGGPIAFGRDGKLYIYSGDTGRRGQLQNLPDGPGCVTNLTPVPSPGSCPAVPMGNMADDQYGSGGPEPDDAHLTGMILRLNDDGSTPTDNPFYRAGEEIGGEAGENWQKIFAYGIRNGFGMAFDPHTGDLWDTQNGDDSFSEINLVQPGINMGWIQNMGPLSRVGEYRAIETTPPFAGTQQFRWNPLNAASDPAEARAQMFHVTEGGSRFTAILDSAHEVPANDSAATGRATFQKQGDTIRYTLSLANITDATMAHIHLGAPGQNGPVVAFLLGPVPGGMDVGAEQQVAAGTITAADIIARPRFDGTMAELLKRLRQGRAYVNVHTVARPPGEIRGKIQVTDAKVVSKYSDPEFSWRYEVAPGGIGFMSTLSMGGAYHKDMFVGAASGGLQGGPIFRFKLRGSRNSVEVAQFPGLADEVADNNAKYDITESEPMLFGTNFGVTTDIQTGPNGHLYVVSLTRGAVYRIHKKG